MKTGRDFSEAKSTNTRNFTSQRLRRASSPPKQNERALTRLQVLVVIGMLALLAVVLGTKISNAAQRARRISCVCHLKQVGLAYRMWSNDHSNHFPWQLSTTTGGTLEWISGSNISVHFVMASNELNSPKVLICPADSDRAAAKDFNAPFGSNNISYFLGLDADETNPYTFLSGDRTLSTKSTIQTGLFVISATNPPTWAPGLHLNGGNIGFADGSVQQLDRTRLLQSVASKSLSFRILLP